MNRVRAIVLGYSAAAVIIGGALYLAWPSDACAQGGGCLGHICVSSMDCPRGCHCSRAPWEPQGDCS